MQELGFPAVSGSLTLRSWAFAHPALATASAIAYNGRNLASWRQLRGRMPHSQHSLN
jgi:hypothetical protein